MPTVSPHQPVEATQRYLRKSVMHTENSAVLVGGRQVLFKQDLDFARPTRNSEPSSYRGFEPPSSVFAFGAELQV